MYKNVFSLCSFCNIKEESIHHLFYHRPFTKSFWSEFTMLVFLCCNFFLQFTETIIFLSYFHSANVNLDYTVLLLCLLGKFQLHKARTIRYNTNFRMFSLDIKSLVTFFKNMLKLLNSKASRTFNMLESVVMNLYFYMTMTMSVVFCYLF